MEELDKLIKQYEELIEPDFDFNWDHNENGNYDDSCQYGFESAEQYCYQDITEELKKLRTILENK